MTRRTENTTIEQVLEELITNGMDGLEAAVSVLINEAMKVERSRALGASPWQRSRHRRGHANGYKPRTLKSRIGRLSLQVPQVRGDVKFYPSARRIFLLFFTNNQLSKNLEEGSCRIKVNQ